MHLHACLTLVLLPWAAATYGQRDSKFCSLVKKAVTVLHEQQQATSYCVSYLKLSTVYQTKTVTSTASITTTAVTTITTTSTPTVTATAQAVNTISSDATIDTTISAIATTTTVVATSTVFTTTETQIETATATAQTTTTTTSTTTTDLASCTAPAFLKKRQLGYGKSVPVPKCFSGYRQASVISRACSCLSIPRPTSTRTTTISTTKTITSSSTVTTTKTAATAVTVTVTTTSITTLVSTIYRTQTVVTTLTISSTATTSLATTTTSTTTSTTTETSTETATAQRYANFALYHGVKKQYSIIQDTVGGSGSGVYFNNNDLGTAATFSFAGTKLYYDNQYISSYQASSGNYYVVFQQAVAQFGYGTDCTLTPPTFSGDGCALDCRVGGSGIFSPASGNDEINYGGAWGFQGPTDRFTVYAVGQT